MSNFIKNYLDELRNSDESTKHRSAMTISIVLSIIILSIAFTLLRTSIFDFSKNNSPKEEVVSDDNSKNEVVSPFQSIKNFFSQTSREFSGIKSNINESANILTSKNSTSSTSTDSGINIQESTTSTSTLIEDSSVNNN